MNKNFFDLIMEADEDQAAAPDASTDSAPADMPTDMPTDAPADDGTADAGGGDAGGGLEDFSFDDASAGGDMGGGDAGGDMGMGGDTSGDGSDQQQGDKQEESISEKASQILNQKLYRQFTDRNKEIEDILADYQVIVPVLSNEIVNDNNVSIDRLKKAHAKGKEYVINKFIDSKYGENLTFYKSLDTLYKILLDSIDKNLKKMNR